MNRQHLHAKFGGGFDRMRDRIRNVVQLQIEKNFCAGSQNVTHNLGSGRGINLQTDFKKRDLLSQLLDKIERFERERVPVDAYGVGSAFFQGTFDFTADVVMVEGRPCAKAGRRFRPNPRLEPVT